MKQLLIVLLFSVSFFTCDKEVTDPAKQIENLKSEIEGLHKEISGISNELEALSFEGLHYFDNEVEAKIEDFREKSISKEEKIAYLENEFNETVEFETLVCADFESAACFVENWDILKPDDGVVEITPDCSYNGTSSLRLSAPFIEGAHNIPGIRIDGYINNVEATTIYKIRFWIKYSGMSEISNNPLITVSIWQDGDWLDAHYEGNNPWNANQYFEKDWAFYSFQIATLTDSPLEISVWTNLEEVCMDDIHIVKKDG
jgi:hypothetical protein